MKSLPYTETEKDEKGRLTGPVRKAFEAWARENHNDRTAARFIKPKGDGSWEYCSPTVDSEWDGFRACLVWLFTFVPEGLPRRLLESALSGDEVAARALKDFLLDKGVI